MRIPSLDLTLARVFASSVKLESVSEVYFTLDATIATPRLPRRVGEAHPTRDERIRSGGRFGGEPLRRRGRVRMIPLDVGRSLVLGLRVVELALSLVELSERVVRLREIGIDLGRGFEGLGGLVQLAALVLRVPEIEQRQRVPRVRHQHV